MPGRLFQICRCDCGTVPKNLRNATSSDRAAKSQPLRLKFKCMQCQLAIVPGKMPWKSFWSLSISTCATMVALIPNAFFAASWPGDGLFFVWQEIAKKPQDSRDLNAFGKPKEKDINHFSSGTTMSFCLLKLHDCPLLPFRHLQHR